MQHLKNWHQNVGNWGRLSVLGWVVLLVPLAWDTLVFAHRHHWSEVVSRIIPLFCISWRLWLIVTGKISRSRMQSTTDNPPVTALQVCLVFMTLFLALAFMVNNGSHALTVPTHIDPLNRGWTTGFLFLAGFFGIWPLVHLIAASIQQFRRSSGFRS